jgi:hypothetical protein
MDRSVKYSDIVTVSGSPLTLAWESQLKLAQFVFVSNSFSKPVTYASFQDILQPLAAQQYGGTGS